LILHYLSASVEDGEFLHKIKKLVVEDFPGLFLLGKFGEKN